jgi:aldehyde:ferredoxin oxidoreductase
LSVMGYNGKILHVDLASLSSEIEEPDPNFWRLYGGGGLLATYYLLKMTPPRADAFDPWNLLIFTSSVVAGQCAGNWKPARILSREMIFAAR